MSFLYCAGMNGLNILYLVLSIAVIIVALAIVAVCIGLFFLLHEARRAIHTVQKTASDISNLKENFSSGMIGNVITFGKNIFQKKPRND